MKTILLFDPRFPDRAPTRYSLRDELASAAVRAGVAAAAHPNDAGLLSAGGPLDPASLTTVVVQHGINQDRLARIVLPLSVVMVGAGLGVLASIGLPVSPGGPAAPSFIVSPSIFTDGSPSVGEFVAFDFGAIAGDAVGTRQILRADNSVVATVTTGSYQLAEAGQIKLRVYAAATVGLYAETPLITVAAARIPKPVISIVMAGENPPRIAIDPDTYLDGDHLILRIYDDVAATKNLIVDDHVLTADEIGAEDVTWQKLTARPAGKHYYDLECVRNGVSGGRSIAISDTVAAALVAPRFVQNQSTGRAPTNDGRTIASFAGGGRYPYNVATPMSTGKVCAELTLDSYNDALLFGFAAQDNLTQNQFPGYSAAPTFCAGAGGNPWKTVLNGNDGVAIANWATGDVIMWAFDFDANRAYLRRNGVWIIGDPEAGTGGIDIGARGTTPVYLTVTLGATSAAADQATLTATTQPPAGFTYWS